MAECGFYVVVIVAPIGTILESDAHSVKIQTIGGWDTWTSRERLLCGSITAKNVAGTSKPITGRGARRSSWRTGLRFTSTSSPATEGSTDSPNRYTNGKAFLGFWRTKPTRRFTRSCIYLQ